MYRCVTLLWSSYSGRQEEETSTRNRAGPGTDIGEFRDIARVMFYADSAITPQFIRFAF